MVFRGKMNETGLNLWHDGNLSKVTISRQLDPRIYLTVAAHDLREGPGGWSACVGRMAYEMVSEK